MIYRNSKLVDSIYEMSHEIAKVMRNSQVLYENLKETTLVGYPPIYLKSDGTAISEYQISGNAEGIGDRTYNLYNWKDTSNRRNLWHSATIYTYDSTRLLIFIPCVGGETYTIYRFDNASAQCSMSQCQRIPERGISYAIDGVSTFVNLGFERVYTFTANSSAKYISLSVGLGFSLEQTIEQILPKIMICRSSSIALSYEPFGYKIPIVLNGVTHNVYLDEPLHSGDYIKRNADGTGVLHQDGADTPITLPQLSTVKGNNELNISTTVTPEVTLKGKIKQLPDSDMNALLSVMEEM